MSLFDAGESLNCIATRLSGLEYPDFAFLLNI